MENMFLDKPELLLRTLIVGVIGYMGIVLMLRISGKRTLSKMNMFDFVVTVAFGSILATLLMSNNTSVVRALTAFAVLIGLQFIVTWLSVRFSAFSDAVKAEPKLLFMNGEFLKKAMHDERVNKSELYSAIRDSSIGSTGDVAAMVLETDGTISVIPKSKLGDGNVLPSGAGA